jgi:hypothetical protein
MESLFGRFIMDIDTEKVIKEVLWKFAGRIKPIGDSSFDEKCLENTDNWKETMVFITNHLFDIYSDNINSPYGSQKKIAEKIKKDMENITKRISSMFDIE